MRLNWFTLCARLSSHAILTGNGTRFDNPADCAAKLWLFHFPRAIYLCLYVVCFPFSTNQMHRSYHSFFNWLVVYGMNKCSGVAFSFHPLLWHFEILVHSRKLRNIGPAFTFTATVSIVPCDAPQIWKDDAYCVWNFMTVIFGVRNRWWHGSNTYDIASVMPRHCQPIWHLFVFMKKRMQTIFGRRLFEIQSANFLRTHVTHSLGVNREKSSTKGRLNLIRGDDWNAPSWGFTISMLCNDFVPPFSIHSNAMARWTRSAWFHCTFHAVVMRRFHARFWHPVYVDGDHLTPLNVRILTYAIFSFFMLLAFRLDWRGSACATFKAIHEKGIACIDLNIRQGKHFASFFIFDFFNSRFFCSLFAARAVNAAYRIRRNLSVGPAHCIGSPNV